MDSLLVLLLFKSSHKVIVGEYKITHIYDFLHFFINTVVCIVHVQQPAFNSSSAPGAPTTQRNNNNTIRLLLNYIIHIKYIHIYVSLIF